MKKSRFTEEQIAYALRESESGTAVADVCRQVGVSEATFYVWKKKFAHLGRHIFSAHIVAGSIDTLGDERVRSPRPQESYGRSARGTVGHRLFVLTN
jgi:transposase-like protein